MHSVLIFGASGLGRLVLDILRRNQNVSVRGFLDSDTSKHGRSIDGIPVLGGLDETPRLIRDGITHAVVAIGDNPTRVALGERLRERGMRLMSAIHPLASIASSATLDEHVIIGARAVICIHSTIGPHSVVSTGAIVDHDSRIGAGAFLHPAVKLAGGVRVEPLVTLCIGCSVIPGRTIGRRARVEAGSVVIRDIGDGSRVTGVPARVVTDENLDALAEIPAQVARLRRAAAHAR